MTGSQAERDLATALDDCGFAVMRAPASGAGTTREMPDVLAGRTTQPSGTAVVQIPSECLAIELKATSSTAAYVDASEVTALERFAVDFGARALLAVKFKGAGTRTRYWLVAPEAARMTDAGTFGLPHEGIAERAEQVVLPATDTMDAEVRTP